MIAHFWVIAQRVSGHDLVTTAPTVRWEALAAWVLAAVLSKNVAFFVTDAFEGLVLGFVLYAAFGLAGNAVRGRAAGGVTGTAGGLGMTSRVEGR
jgi:cytosine permease